MGICKRIPAEKKSVSSASRARNLANYITNPQLENGLEKCVWSGAKGFFSNTHEGRVAEMISLAGESKHSKDPLDHWMISLHDDEKFSQEQAEQAVDIFLQHTGLEGHQVIWGVHDDTKNRHIHISVNRVNPQTLLVEKINKGFNKEAGQQVIALIEHTQGWKHEKGARYTVIGGVPVMTAEAAKTKAQRMAGSNEPKKPSQKAQDMEQQTGTKSAQRIGIEGAAPAIQQARTWRELHDNLAAFGMSYVRKGSGALIFIGDQPIKASDVSRSASLSALQKRFGPFQPSQEISKNDYHHHRAVDRNQATQQNLAAPGKEPWHPLQNLRELGLPTLQESGQTKRAGVLSLDAQLDRHRDIRLRRNAGREIEHLQPLKPNQAGWKEYQVIKEEQRAAKAVATADLSKQQDAKRTVLFEKQKEERNAIFKSIWVGRGVARNAKQSELAVRHAAEKLALSEQQRAQRTALFSMYKPLPQYKQWKEQPLIVCGKAQSTSEQQVESKKRSVSLSMLVSSLKQTQDFRGHFTYKLSGVSIFRDEGKTLAVLDQSSQSIAATLAVAQQRFGQTLVLTGDDVFKRRAVTAAVENNMSVKFADPVLENMRVKMQEDKRQAERDAQRQARAEEQASPLPERAAPEPETHVPFVSPIPTPLLPSAYWITTQSKPVEPMRIFADGKLEFIVAHVADSVVVDYGRTVAEHPVQPDCTFKPGQRVVINKDGSLSLSLVREIGVKGRAD